MMDGWMNYVVMRLAVGVVEQRCPLLSKGK